MGKLNIDVQDTTCPSVACGKHRYFFKFYCGKEIFYCQDCGYWAEI